MSSQSVSANSSSALVRLHCRCGVVAPLKFVLTEANARRRFFGCGNFQRGRSSCGFFKWFDPPVSEHLKAFLYATLEEEEYKLKYLRCVEQRGEVQRGIQAK